MTWLALICCFYSFRRFGRAPVGWFVAWCGVVLVFAYGGSHRVVSCRVGVGIGVGIDVVSASVLESVSTLGLGTGADRLVLPQSCDRAARGLSSTPAGAGQVGPRPVCCGPTPPRNFGPYQLPALLMHQTRHVRPPHPAVRSHTTQEYQQNPHAGAGETSALTTCPSRQPCAGSGSASRSTRPM